MSILIFIFYAVFIPALLIYTVSLIVFAVGSTGTEKHEPLDSALGVSVIVAIRNGARSLPRLLEQLNRQNYAGPVEFILVDDESDDETPDILAEQTKKDPRFRHIHSKQGDSGLAHKKKALSAGIRQSGNEILLFTDADCTIPDNWVSSMVEKFDDSTDYVVGYSEIRPDSSAVSRFQSMDFLMLMTAARGMVRLKHPWAATGQNQAYRRSVFQLTNGFAALKHCLQGDDSLYLQVARKAGIRNVNFAEPDQTCVAGRTENTWSGLIRQRIRWAGDANIMWRYNPVFFMTILATFIANAGVTVMFILIPAVPEILYWLSGILILKLMGESLVFNSGKQHLASEHSWKNFYFWFLLQPVYITFMGLASFFAPRFAWRGRVLKNFGHVL